MKAIKFNRFGDPNVLHLAEVSKPKPLPGMAIARIACVGVNRADCLWRSRLYMYSPQKLPCGLGIEAVAEIVETQDTSGPFKVGDMVCLAGGSSIEDSPTYGEYVAVRPDILLPYPKGVSQELASSFWMPFLTSWLALWPHKEKIQNSNVVVTAPSSPTGLAALQVIRILGGKSIALTTSQSKLERIGKFADHGLLVGSGGADWSSEIRSISGPEGVSLLFDSVAGPALDKLFDCLSNSAVAILYGVLAGQSSGFPFLKALRKSITTHTFSVNQYLGQPNLNFKRQQPIIDAAIAQLLPRFESSIFQMPLDSVWGLEQAREAHERMETGEQFGKILLKI